jgi:predicted enzyme related to lactoylglutathione lyase
MPTVTVHPQGTFCWIELATTDAPGAKTFYERVFHWTVLEQKMGGELGSYSIFQKDGRDAAAMYQMGAQEQGLPPRWLSYIAVTDADASADRVKALGGTVVMGPFDVAELGRMAVVTDPQGATFALWQGRLNPGLRVRDEENSLCWNELSARDLESSKLFYPALFGWRFKETEDYVEFHLAEHAVGGMMQSHAPAHIPPHWLPYFAVADCDATLALAKAEGARVLVEPMDIGGVGRFAVLADPQGAPFAIIRLMM